MIPSMTEPFYRMKESQTMNQDIHVTIEDSVLKATRIKCIRDSTPDLTLHLSRVIEEQLRAWIKGATA